MSSKPDIFAEARRGRFSRNGFRAAFVRKAAPAAPKRARPAAESACLAALEACAGYNLRRTSRIVTSLYDAVLEPTGIRSTQAAILQMIMTNEAPSNARLARAMAMDPSTLTRNLQPLVRKGYVELIQAPRGRAKLARLTPSGQAKLEEVMRHWKEAQAAFIKRFGAKRWNQLRGELLAVVASLE